MRLFLVELKRFWGRRITWVTMAVIMFLFLLVVGIAYVRTSGEAPSADQVVVVNQSCVDDVSSMRDAGEPGFADLTDEEIANNFCVDEFADPDGRFWATEILGNRTSDWSARQAQKYEQAREPTIANGIEYKSARSGNEGIVPGISVLLLAVAVVLGGSYVGAEYKSGTVENLLLWEPRRLKVIGTKFLAGAVSAAVVMALAMVALGGLLALLAATKGTFEGVDSQFYLDFVYTLGRSGLVAGLFFILAMSVSTLARNTTAAVAIVLGWFVASNILIEWLLPGLRQYELFINSTQFISNGDVIKYVKDGPYDRYAVFAHGPWTALLYLLVWTLVPALLATIAFKRRDLT